MSNQKDFSNVNKTNSSFGSPVKIILGALLVVAVGIAIYFGVNSNRFQGETVKLQDQLSELNDTRDELEDELQLLEGEYTQQISENDSLRMDIEEQVAEVENLKARLSQVRSQLTGSKADSRKIRERLAQLEELKVALETDIEGLKVRNTELMATNDELNTVLETSKEEIVQLNLEVNTLNDKNEALNERLFLVAPAGYRADNFSIVAEKRNDKVTNKAKRVDEVKVKFNLNNVPIEKQRGSELYIAVTDLLGESVKAIPAQNVIVKGRNQQLNVQAADIEKVNLKDFQSVAMSFKPTDDMKSGEYNLMVYSSDGYLGSTGFVLQ